MADYRVGVNQYLVLGALVQAPRRMLTEAQLRAHFNRHRVEVNMPVLLRTLEKRGAIRRDPLVNSWYITPYGGEARCAGPRKTTDRFLSVEWSGILEMVDAS